MKTSVSFERQHRYHLADIISYGIDGREGMAAAFDGRTMERNPVRLAFKSVEEQDGIVWVRYQVVNS